MINYYTVVDGFLESSGSATEPVLASMRKHGADIRIGMPPGFPGRTPFAGAKWHVARGEWVDTNDVEQMAIEMKRRILENRHGAYPPLADFVDAYYWQTRGDSSKMIAYLARCDAVKQLYPKN